MKLSDLHKTPDNPRKITKEKQEALKKAMETFGHLDGCVYNRSLEKLVTFHHRQDVLDPNSEVVITKKFETPTKDGTVALGHIKAGDQVFPYREVSWDEATHKLAMLTANENAAHWDLKELPNYIQFIDENNMDIDLSLMDSRFLENIMAPVSEVNKGNETAEWVNLPEMKEASKEIRLVIIFSTELERESFSKKHKLNISKKMTTVWICHI